MSLRPARLCNRERERKGGGGRGKEEEEEERLEKKIEEIAAERCSHRLK